MSEAPYFAKGLEVWKRPISRPLASGGRATTLGFKVCTASIAVGEEGAQTIAEMLSVAETPAAASNDSREPAHD